ncbi:DUF4231 domain-containing protein [Micromonospora olivasterospora]|uniref:DUF4231 domain-containing protein n=1 Tax=Micromonospora olivasterospora TaxID=1880 RepID=UPI001FEAC3ED|nr:DUF4231 domain-containing protein [Micromonospora olivasterospora]
MADFDASVVSRVWRRQSLWSEAAQAAKRRIVRARRGLAVLTVIGAVAGTAAARLAGVAPAAGRALAIVAAVALLLAPVVARWASRDAVRAWTRLRSVSEALKAEVYRYLAGTAPFAGTDRDAVLLRRFDRLLDDAGDLAGHTLDVAPAERPLPPVSDVASYRAERVRRQVDDYLLPAARRAGRAAARIGYAAVALTVVAALLSATAGVLGDGLGLTAWVGVAAAVTTALTGYAATQRYEQQQIEYAHAADQLTRLCLTREAGQGWADDDVFVAEAERILALSNEGWMAKMIEDDGTAQS